MRGCGPAAWGSAAASGRSLLSLLHPQDPTIPFHATIHSAGPINPASASLPPPPPPPCSRQGCRGHRGGRPRPAGRGRPRPQPPPREGHQQPCAGEGWVCARDGEAKGRRQSGGCFVRNSCAGSGAWARSGGACRLLSSGWQQHEVRCMHSAGARLAIRALCIPELPILTAATPAQ